MFALVTEIHGQQRVFEFDKQQLAIGRDRQSDFVLDHPTVSRQHALIVWDGYFKLVVLSRGGLTAIDGHQVAGEVPLFDGSHVMFGQLAFMFRSQHAPAKPPTGYRGHSSAFASPFGGAADAMQVTGDGMFQPPGHSPSPDATISMQALNISGQFPSMAEHEKLARMIAVSEEGVQSWDEIAAVEDDAPRDALAAFEQMQKEQEKRTGGSRGPLLFIIATLAVGAIALALIYGNPGAIITQPDAPEPVDPVELATPIILWRPDDATCHNVAACHKAATDAFNVGKINFERREADITNLYESFKQLSLAEKYLEQGGDTPPGFAELAPLREQIALSMETHFMQLRANFIASQDRSDYAKMAETLSRIHAYYPDDRLNFHRWSSRRVNEMKSNSVYPQSLRSN